MDGWRKEQKMNKRKGQDKEEDDVSVVDTLFVSFQSRRSVRVSCSGVSVSGVW